MEKKGEKQAEAHPQPEGRLATVALVVAIMAVVFSLAIGPRLRGAEREQALLRSDLDGIRQEMAALRREIAQAREEQMLARQQPGAVEGERPDVEVTDAEGTVVNPNDARQIGARLAILDARHARMVERFNRLVKDLKANGVDLGVSDPGL